MKTFFSRLSHRVLFLIAALAEVAMGGAQFLIVLIQNADSPLHVIPLYFFQCLHIILSVAVISAALQYVNRKQMKVAVYYLIAFIGVLFVKNFFATFFSLVWGEGALAGDAILMSLAATALSTLLFTSLFFFAVFFVAFLFFLYRRPQTTLSKDPWALTASPMSGAALTVAVLITLPEWVTAIVNQVDFLVNDVIFMPTGIEVFNMLFEFFAIPLFGLVAYIVAHAILYFGLSKPSVAF